MQKMQMYDQAHRDKLFRACHEDVPPDDPLCVMKCQNLIYAIDALQKAMESTAEENEK